MKWCEKYKYLYLITNMISMKQYAGSRSCECLPEEDVKYMGSSMYLNADIKLIGSENFKKEILEILPICITHDEMIDKESEIIISYNTLAPNGYNRFIPNKRTKFYVTGTTIRQRMKMKYSEELYNEKIKVLSEKQSNISKERKGKKNGMYGKHHTEESNTKNRLSQPYLNKHLPEWVREKIREGTTGENNPFYGKRHSDETKQRISDAKKGKRISDDAIARGIQTRKTNGSLLGEKNGMYGKCWISNKLTNENKAINVNELEHWINNGWRKGMIQIKKIKTC